MTHILTLPGINNSGPQHWQTLWEQQHKYYQRVNQDNWDYPDCATWVKRLDEVVAQTGQDTVLVAHSLACLVVAHWANSTKHTIKGALLVSVPDPYGPNFPTEAQGFAPLPTQRFAFPSVIVASTNDPYGSIEHSQQYAQHWGSEWLNVGALGHINASSGLGNWPQGQTILEQFLQTLPK